MPYSCILAAASATRGELRRASNKATGSNRGQERDTTVCMHHTHGMQAQTRRHLVRQPARLGPGDTVSTHRAARSLFGVGKRQRRVRKEGAKKKTRADSITDPTEAVHAPGWHVDAAVWSAFGDYPPAFLVLLAAVASPRPSFFLLFPLPLVSERATGVRASVQSVKPSSAQPSAGCDATQPSSPYTAR